jgi:hypothetical protein
VVLRNGKQYQPPQRTPSAAVDHGAVSAGVDAMAGNARPAFDVRLPRTAVPADYTILFAVILAPFLTLPPAWWLWNLVRSIRLGEFRSPPRPHFHAH